MVILLIIQIMQLFKQPNLRPVVTEVVSSARQLYEESCELLRDKAHNLVCLRFFLRFNARNRRRLL